MRDGIRKAEARDRKRQPKMPLHGLAYVRTITQMIVKRGKGRG